MIRINIIGDLYPGGRYEELFINNEVSFDDLTLDFENADLNVSNLECPITNSVKPITKRGKNIKASTRCIHGLLKTNIDVFNLSNNHIYDYGDEGLNNTTEILKNNNLDFFVIGENENAANQLYIKKIKNKRIAFYGIAENEFSQATNKTAGANPLCIMNFIKMLNVNKGKYDYLIIMLHGGLEYYKYPSPNMQKLCWFLIDCGSSAVICQHTHVLGSYEIYENKPIIYGQGDFIFDNPKLSTIRYKISTIV